MGALIGVGIAADLKVSWGWTSHSVSQIAASWGIAPAISACFGAILFMTIRFVVFSRSDPMKWALRVIPFYYALTAGILVLFIVVEGSNGIPSLEEMGAGKACGIIIGVFAGVWLIGAIFFVPYYHRKYGPFISDTGGLHLTFTGLLRKTAVSASGTSPWDHSYGETTTLCTSPGTQTRT